MCAKVTGPLQSFSAAGKVANSLIFQTHNGQNVVRQYFRPTVANTMEQTNNRIYMAVVSQGLAAVLPSLPYTQDLLTVVPSGQTWSSYIQQYATRRFGRGTTGLNNFRLDVQRHPNHANLALFAARIQFKGFVFDNGIFPDTVISAAAVFYLLAELAFELKERFGLYDRDVYNTPLDSWTLNEAIEFKSDFTDRTPTA